MGNPQVTDSQAAFQNGYNSSGAVDVVDPSQFSAVQNMRVVRSGEMAKRPGLQPTCHPASASNASSAWAWQPIGSAGQVVMMDAGSNFQYGALNATTGVITLTTSGTPLGTASTVAPFRDATHDVLYISNNGGLISKWDGTTLTANSIGTPTGLNNLWVYNQRLYGAKNNEQKIYWSDLNNGDTIGTTASGGGFAEIRTFGGGVVLGGFALGGSNYIVHTNALSVFTGRTFDDIQIAAGTQGVTPEISPLGSNSFCVIDDVGYIATKAGLCMIAMGGTFSRYEQPDLPDPIRELCATYTHTPLAFIANNARANEIWVLVLDAVSGDATIFMYSKRYKRFTGQAKFTTSAYAQYTPKAIFSGFDSAGNSQIFILSGDGVYACDFATSSLDNFADTGAIGSYRSSVTCRRFFTDSPESIKAWRQLYVQMGAGAKNATAYDTATAATTTYTTPVGGTVADANALHAGASNVVQASGQGPYIDVTISDAGSTSTDWSVYRVDVMGFDYGLRGR